MASKKYQTLADFMRRPFHKAPDYSRDSSYEKTYKDFVSKNKIYLKACTIIGDSYYLHLKIPSESLADKGQEYDVVVRFFTDDPNVLNQPDLNLYYIQFFSNSPGFIYHYAYLYKKNGYLIEDLFEKIDGEFENKPPSKTNPKGVMSYDKSIYLATRYLYETRFRMLHKRGFLLFKNISSDKFFRNINDFETVKFDQTIISEEKKLQKELSKAGSPQIKQKSLISAKKTAGHSAVTKASSASITVVKKKNGSAKIITKKKAGKSTFKK